MDYFCLGNRCLGNRLSEFLSEHIKHLGNLGLVLFRKLPSVYKIGKSIFRKSTFRILNWTRQKFWEQDSGLFLFRKLVSRKSIFRILDGIPTLKIGEIQNYFYLKNQCLENQLSEFCTVNTSKIRRIRDYFYSRKKRL